MGNLVSKIFFRFLSFFEKIIGKFSLFGDTPFFKLDHFPWIKKLEAEWKIMRDELDVVLQKKEQIPNYQDVSPNQAYVATGDNWKTYFFYVYGHKAKKNCVQCPQTTKLVQSIPGMKTAYFSILKGGKSIPTHRGVYKGVLRYHLGLKIPTPVDLCGIEVEEKTNHWENGKSLVFDDMYPHRVWNWSNEIRVILFVDFLRPLPFPLSWINRIVLWLISRSRFVLEGVERFKEMYPGN